MATEKDGGPAFPLGVAVRGVGDVYSSKDIVGGMGMSLRDWFAGQAMATMSINTWSDNPLYWKGVAKSAYVAADAMLAERERQS